MKGRFAAVWLAGLMLLPAMARGDGGFFPATAMALERVQIPDQRALIYPDYVRVCNSFNVKCERVMYKKDLRPAIQRMLAAREPYVLDVIVPYTEHVLPFIPAGRTVAAVTLISPYPDSTLTRLETGTLIIYLKTSLGR